MTVAPATHNRPDSTDDAFLGGALHLLQLRTGYRAGLDAVMLAAAVPADPERPLRVLDVGAGVGTAGLCLARRAPLASVVLLEKEWQPAELASENARRNHLADRVRVVTAVVGAAASELRAAGLAEESFAHVIANPPYHDADAGTLAADALKAGAHAMADGELELWARFMARMTAPGGEATIVHKTEALPRLLAAFATRFGSLKILPLHPRHDAPANRVLLQGVKGSRGPLQILPGFILHEGNGAFTPAAQGILRAGGALPMSAAG
ncbi:MAG TPA: methyltransferase [Hyphomicrobium sp.]|jgi:tRNA1(Val) A37 N6-methylase TrmN6